ncbi:MAG: poly-gamma-glutamate synthase PgsB [Acidobacteriota bacterium]
MTIELWLTGALLVLLAGAGAAERLALARARAALPIRIHVNGTRGKSTVTRLIWSALREAGVPTLAKTSGTAARLLLPDGSEQPIHRHAPANIREQLRFMLLARRLGVRAVVVECMALRPELQWTTEHDILRATIGVITNVRTDHTEVMGPTLAEIAASLANTVPRGAVLVTGESRHAEALISRAAALRARVVEAALDAADGTAAATAPAGWLAEDLAVALAVTRELGIPDAVARAGMAAAPPDPGAATSGAAGICGRSLLWLDATAANDPESFTQLLAGAGLGEVSSPASRPPAPTGGLLVVFNHRLDRPNRLLAFAAGGDNFRKARSLMVTGDRPPLTVWLRLRRLYGAALRFVPSARLARALAGAAPETGGIVFCGNTRGLDVAAILAVAKHG